MKQLRTPLILLLVTAWSADSFVVRHGIQKRSPTEGNESKFNPATSRPRGSTWTGDFMPVSINSNGRNVVVPPRPVSSSTFGEKLVPVFRTEAVPNARLNPSGVIDKTNRKGVEPMLFMGIGSDSKRTEDFMQQSRVREGMNTLNHARETQRASNSATNIAEKTTLQTEANRLKEAAFSANGQTVKSSNIPLNTARRIISSSIPERINTVGTTEKRIGLTSDVKNVDVTKSHNQFGLRGPPLQELKGAIAAQGVQSGTTYGGRRRSEPNIKYSPFALNKPSTSLISSQPTNNGNPNNNAGKVTTGTGSSGLTQKNKNSGGGSVGGSRVSNRNRG